MMRKIVLLAFCSVFVLGVCSNSMAEDKAAQVSEITKDTVMVKGKVFAETEVTSIAENDALSQEFYKDLAKATSLRKDREMSLSKSPKSEECICQACGSADGPCPVGNYCEEHNWGPAPICQACPY